MQIIDKLYENYKPLYPVDRFCDPYKALFVDIETTGLKKETTSLYLIGCGYYCEDGFMTRLFFADNTSEEIDILLMFREHLLKYTHLIHFNGSKFDIPYLEYKAGVYGIPGLFDGTDQIDVYAMCKPLRYLLFPESMRQKAIEGFLGIKREDKFGGGELIEVYKHYEAYNNEADLKLLITHNREDVLGMHLIMPILFYLDFKDAPLVYEDYRINKYTDYNGDECEEVIFEYSTPLSFPRSFVAKTESMYVKASAKDRHLSIRLPIYSGTMKIFFDNYRDYCYIPDEDTALLRSIALTLPKDKYVKATKEKCYQNITGTFIKQPSNTFTPVLRSSYKDKKKYFKFPESFKTEAAEDFGRQLINVFFSMKHR